MKRFHLKIPEQNRLNTQSEDIESLDIEPQRVPRLRNRSLLRPRYQARPNRAAREAVNGTIGQYQQHRQQDIGRAIAQKKYIREEFIGSSGTVWQFREEIADQEIGRYWKYYTVTWDGLGIPIGGLSTAKYSQGFSYIRQDDGKLIIVPGKPCKFTWAVKFLVEGIPPDNLWIPIPSRWAAYPYNSVEPWIEYPI